MRVRDRNHDQADSECDRVELRKAVYSSKDRARAVSRGDGNARPVLQRSKSCESWY
jgi:hypothetical protein